MGSCDTHREDITFRSSDKLETYSGIRDDALREVKHCNIQKYVMSVCHSLVGKMLPSDNHTGKKRLHDTQVAMMKVPDFQVWEITPCCP
jgi:hypothetical protein